MGVHHEETLLGEGRWKRYVRFNPNARVTQRQTAIAHVYSFSFDALKHTARGLEAIGFNQHASMYHVDRNYSPESEDERTLREKEKKQSFLKKLIGGAKHKGEKM